MGTISALLSRHGSGASVDHLGNTKGPVYTGTRSDHKGWAYRAKRFLHQKGLYDLISPRGRDLPTEDDDSEEAKALLAHGDLFSQNLIPLATVR